MSFVIEREATCEVEAVLLGVVEDSKAAAAEGPEESLRLREVEQAECAFDTIFNLWTRYALENIQDCASGEEVDLGDAVEFLRAVEDELKHTEGMKELLFRVWYFQVLLARKLVENISSGGDLTSEYMSRLTGLMATEKTIEKMCSEEFLGALRSFSAAVESGKGIRKAARKCDREITDLLDIAEGECDGEMLDFVLERLERAEELGVFSVGGEK